MKKSKQVLLFLFVHVSLFLSIVGMIYASIQIAQAPQPNPTRIQILWNSYQTQPTSHPYGSVNIGVPPDPSRSGTNLTCNEYLHSEDMIYDQEATYYNVCDPQYPNCPIAPCPLIAYEDPPCQDLHNQLDNEHCLGPSKQNKWILAVSVILTFVFLIASVTFCAKMYDAATLRASSLLSVNSQ
jgi:hypothetical protein